MNCLICNQRIEYQKTWMYLFKDPEYLICNRCFNYFDPRPKRKDIDTGLIRIEWIYLVDKKLHAPAEAFIMELSATIWHLVNTRKDTILYFDYFPSTSVLEVLEAFKENFIIVTCFG